MMDFADNLRSKQADRFSENFLTDTKPYSCDALVIGSGPAGLMAADVMSAMGVKVMLADAKPSFGRKFLMAGKTGLNITKDQPLDAFLAGYSGADWLGPILRRFGPDPVRAWATGLGQEVFTGSSGRVFPKAMKASPLLRAWLGRLAAQGVEGKTQWRWLGWRGEALSFSTPQGMQTVKAKATILALGGASWARLGSDGAWAAFLAAKGVEITPFRPSNVGFDADWSPYMAKFAGSPVKPVSLQVGGKKIRGEFVVTKTGVEGGAIYSLSSAILALQNATIHLDLLPDFTHETIVGKVAVPRGKASFNNHLRKSLGVTGVKAALFHELCDAREPVAIATALKNLPLHLTRPRPIDEAISTAGGIAATSLDTNLMLRNLPGVFCAGEMLDWDAPTGGYLLSACLATGKWAGLGALEYLKAVERQQ